MRADSGIVVAFVVALYQHFARSGGHSCVVVVCASRMCGGIYCHSGIV